MEVSICDINGVNTGKVVNLRESVFSIKPNDHIVYLAIKQYLANKRQGTAKTKERSEISGSTRKIVRQKGGGGARHGDIKSPTMVGGGRAFGPRPKDYGFKLNKKEKILARRSALSYKVLDGSVTVVEDFSFTVPKTKKLLTLLKNLNVSNKKVLVVLSKNDNSIFLSARNLKNVEVVLASDLNIYSILNATHLALLEGSINDLNKF